MPCSPHPHHTPQARDTSGHGTLLPPPQKAQVFGPGKSPAGGDEQRELLGSPWGAPGGTPGEPQPERVHPKLRGRTLEPLAMGHPPCSSYNPSKAALEGPQGQGHRFPRKASCIRRVVPLPPASSVSKPTHPNLPPLPPRSPPPSRRHHPPGLRFWRSSSAAAVSYFSVVDDLNSFAALRGRQ